MPIVFALDLATRSGYAIGAAGASPRSGTIVLKQPSEHRSIALGNLIAWLNEAWQAERPGLVVKEAPLPLQAYRDRANSEAGVLMAYGLHGIVEAMCVRFGIPFEQAHPATIRKHFIGTSRTGDRARTKAAVIQRCHVLDYMPKDCRDDNRADALALWDWASATHGRVNPSRLHLFGETAA